MMRWTAFILLVLGLGAQVRSETPVQTTLKAEAKSRLLTRRIRIDANSPNKVNVCHNLPASEIQVSLKKIDVPPFRRSSGPKTTVRKPVKSVPNRAIQIVPVEDPLLHTLVIDSSASMVSRLEDAKFAANEYLNTIDFTRDRGMVVTFHEDVILERGASRNLEALHAAVDGIKLGKRTSLLDSLALTFKELSSHHARPVVILLSDGADTASFFSREEVIAASRNLPNLIIFSIGIDIGSDSTQELLALLSESTSGRHYSIDSIDQLPGVFNSIRTTIQGERILTIQDPQPNAPLPRIMMKSQNPNCRIRDLERGIGASRALRTNLRSESPSLPQRLTLLNRASVITFDSTCENYRRLPALKSVFDRNGSSVEFCIPDVVRAPGLLFGRDEPELNYDYKGLNLHVRPLKVDLPDVHDLPTEPWQILDLLVDTETFTAGKPWYHSPYLLEGRAFFEARPLLAYEPWKIKDWRTFARRKLQAEADQGIASIRRKFATQFKDAKPEAVQTAARFSQEGVVLRHRVTSPSPRDLQPHLAAWLGDIPAAELFLEWEKTQWKRNRLDDSFLSNWTLLYDVFGTPDHARIVTPLFPFYDDACDCIGYWRIQLPRPGLMHSRRTQAVYGEADTAFEPLPMDLIPDQPLAYRVMTALAQSDPFWDQLLREEAELLSLDYQLQGSPVHWRPETAFKNVKVLIGFKDAKGRTFELAAHVQDEKFKPNKPVVIDKLSAPQYVVTEFSLTRSQDHPVPTEYKQALPKSLPLN